MATNIVSILFDRGTMVFSSMFCICRQPRGGILQRQDSLVSQASSNNTLTTNTRWQTRPLEQWENEDVVDWAEAAGFEELADALHGLFLFFLFIVCLH